MEYFRCSIVGIIAAVLIMVVSVQDGMFEYVSSAQTLPTMNFEEETNLNATEYSDTENESNDEGCLRRVKKHSSRIPRLHFAHFTHYVQRVSEQIILPVPRLSTMSRPLSTLFCTLLI